MGGRHLFQPAQQAHRHRAHGALIDAVESVKRSQMTHFPAARAGRMVASNMVEAGGRKDDGLRLNAIRV